MAETIARALQDSPRDEERPREATPATLERVSVVIPAHDEAEYIRAALASVAAQEYPSDRLECVVVDNASADGTAALAWAFAAECAGLAVVVVREPELGVGRAKNRGARAARGDVLIFLDADSRMEPTLVRAVVARRRAGHLAGSIRVVADSEHPLERGFFALTEVGKVLCGIRAQMLFCERELFLTLGGFRPDLRLAEDVEFLRRVAAHARAHGLADVCHVRGSAIATSTRRLRALPLHLNVVVLFVRWLLAFAGIGRRRRY